MKKRGKGQTAVEFLMFQTTSLKPRKSKSQAAIEFLMTYGWAMLVFFGVIGSMVYLDIFNFDQFVVEKCEFSSGVYCIDGTYIDSQVKLVIQNGMVIDMESIVVQVPDCSLTVMDGPASLASGEQAIFNVTCGVIYDSHIKSTVYFNYTNTDSGLDHRKVGNLLYRIN